MAKITPNQLSSLRVDGGLFRELDVLECLRLSLPDSYEVFHEVTWHSLQDGVDRHGEIDIVVLSPTGDMLLMEVKAGQVLLREGGIYKSYGQQERDVVRQYRVQYAGMVSRLKSAGLHPFLVNCLVLPDYLLLAGQAVSIPRERIIAANDYEQLAIRVQALLLSGHGTASVEDVRRFLCNEFQVSPTISTLRDQLKVATERLSDGLATWIPRIENGSGVFRIQATAGSGKTQLAVRLLENAASSKESALYVCYNRPLADAMLNFAPTRSTISSFHELAVEHYRRSHNDPDFNLPDIFNLIADAFYADSELFEPKYDVLIIDEGQDFAPQWVQSLLPLLKSSGRFFCWRTSLKGCMSARHLSCLML